MGPTPAHPVQHTQHLKLRCPGEALGLARPQSLPVVPDTHWQVQEGSKGAWAPAGQAANGQSLECGSLSRTWLWDQPGPPAAPTLCLRSQSWAGTTEDEAPGWSGRRWQGQCQQQVSPWPSGWRGSSDGQCQLRSSAESHCEGSTEGSPVSRSSRERSRGLVGCVKDKHLTASTV